MLLELLLKTKRFFAKKQLKNNPDLLVIDTTILCNNSCFFCWRKTNPNYLKEINEKYGKNHTMPFKTYKKIIDSCCKYSSLWWLSLCGPMGEPMLNKDLVKFTEYAYKKHHFSKIQINTNGLAIDKHDISRLLNSTTEFSVSIDSINPETYAKIHGAEKYLPKVIENIKKCIEYKKQHGAVARIVVRFTENELNIGQYPEFEKFFKSLGVDDINYTKVHSFAGVKSELANKQTAQNCCQPHKVINFNFMGDLTTCCINWQINPTFGNINDHSIEELWENQSMKIWQKTRLECEPCLNCNGLGHEQQKEGLLNA